MLRYAIEDVEATQQVTLGAVSSTPVLFQAGKLLLLRRTEFKGQFFVPYDPATHVLLLFPCSASLEERLHLAPGAADKISSYLSSIGEASGVSFEVTDAALCTVSGSAALILRCDSVTNVLALLEYCAESMTLQTTEHRMTPLFIQSFPCSPLPSSCTRAADILSNHYFIPNCVLCADRLEANLREYFTDEAICGCGRHCSCIYASTCRVCHMFVQQGKQQHGNGTVSNNNNISVAKDEQAQQRGTIAVDTVVRCHECREAGDPWICLLCGYVGCSRYQAMHAKDHCLQCRHFFSINLLTQQIWDYESDSFAHRMVIAVDSVGVTTRVQFPDREEPLVEEDVDDEDDEAVDLKLVGKKAVNAKYDTKLSTSHTQYATILKKELDAARATYEDTLGMTVATASAASNGNSMAGTPFTAGKKDALYSNENSSARSPYAVMDELLAAVTTRLPAPGGAFSRPTASTSMGAILLAHRAAKEAEAALGELEMEGQLLESDEAQLKAKLRDAIRQNVSSDLELVTEISEVESTLKEIELNLRMQASLQQRMGSGDSAAYTVIMGGGQEQPRKKRGGKK